MSSLPGALPTTVLPAGSALWRVHASSRGAIWFGPAPGEAPRNRFDAPAGEYRVCYLGEAREVAVAETILRQPHMRLVPRAAMDDRIVSRIPVVRDVTVVRVHGPGLARLGIGADVAHGHPYDACQTLALELWSHDAGVDGLEYRSRWDNDRMCFALFDRAADALAAPDYALRLADPVVSSPILRLYGIGLL